MIALPPSYLLCLSRKTGAVLGALRILQTMGGPYALNHLVPELIDNDHAPRSPCLWEIGRICVSRELNALAPGITQAQVMGELMIGALEIAKASGVQDYIMILNRLGEAAVTATGVLFGDVLGRTLIERWGVEQVAVTLDCEDEQIRRIRATVDLKQDIWAPCNALDEFKDKSREPRLTVWRTWFRRRETGIRRTVSSAGFSSIVPSNCLTHKPMKSATMP